MKSDLPDSSSPPFTIAVTGSAGSGKSFVCRRISDLGGVVLDADQIARAAVAPGTPGLAKIASHFGPGILTAEGMLDRGALRRRIISDPFARKALEAILHPEILARMEDEIRTAHQRGEGPVVAEIPLLFELGWQDRFDRVVVVTADQDTKIRRLTARDGVSEADAASLLALQLPDEEKARNADYLIENNGSLEELIKKIDRVYEMIYADIGRVPT